MGFGVRDVGSDVAFASLLGLERVTECLLAQMSLRMKAGIMPSL